MLRSCLLALFVVLAAFVLNAVAQDTSQRTRDLVASLDKTKYKKKEKANVSVEVYVDIKNTAAPRANPADYSGLYDSDGYRLQLDVAADGSATGSGFDTLFESGKSENFALKDAHVDGALLTAMKVYDNGRQERFEAVFVDRTSRSGRNPNDLATTDTKFGVGFVQVSSNDPASKSRVFLEKR